LDIRQTQTHWPYRWQGISISNLQWFQRGRL
jgi:hypothetical protein